MTEPRAFTHAPRYPAFWRQPLVKIGIAFLILAGFMAWNYVHRPLPHPIGGLGPEWECDAARPICVKDVRIVRPDSIVDKPRAGQP